MPAVVRDLTWAGHDFLGVLENATVWGKIKQKFTPAELGGRPHGPHDTAPAGFGSPAFCVSLF
jgi:hypothetical protein